MYTNFVTSTWRLITSIIFYINILSVKVVRPAKKEIAAEAAADKPAEPAPAAAEAPAPVAATA